MRNNTRETIEFLYSKLNEYIFILGNHESYVARYFRNEIDAGEEKHSNIDVYKEISNDDCLIVDIPDNGDYSEALEKANQFYSYVTETLKLEGVVVKPEFVFTKDIAPYFKCRNEKYLSLIYGYDYQKHYDYMIDTKSISRKIESSIYEFYLGKLMLETKYSDIVRENTNYVKTLALMIGEINKEASIDTRL